MLRVCVINSLLQTKALRKPLLFQKITTALPACSSLTSRQFAIKLSEPQDQSLEKIYYGPLTPQIKAVKVFSLSSSGAGLIAQPIIIREAATIGNTSLLIALCSVVGFFTFVTPLLLHLITKKYVTEIHYNPKTSTYRAQTINFFLVRKHLEFKVDDIEVPDVPGMFTTLHAKGVPLFVEARHFSDPMHYAKMMGYDKPMDFKMGEEMRGSSK